MVEISCIYGGFQPFLVPAVVKKYELALYLNSDIAS